jgi:hypothetical protein
MKRSGQKKPNKRVGKTRRKTHATLLVELAGNAELFHTPEGEAFATFRVQDHRETWPLRSQSFGRWLERRFYMRSGTAPSSFAVRDAVNVLEARARIDGAARDVFVRVAESEGAIYLDLVNDDWQIVEITADGWRITTDAPVRFKRTRGMLPLPVPASHGKLERLRKFLNLRNDEDWYAVAGWLVGALHPRGPYPVLVLHGEQGSAKSTAAKVLRSLIDPHSAPLRAAPRELRDLMITAMNSRCLAFDNMSHVTGALSDALCQIASGGGFATRELYTDREEVIFRAARPIILNGIEELVTRPDLLDRAIVVYLPSIPVDKRKPENVFWHQFHEELPRLLTGLLRALVMALRKLPRTRLPYLPRMADFALWVTAAESALGWPKGAFLAAYTANMEMATDLALEASALAPVLIKFINEQARLAETESDPFDEPSEWMWSGTASDLLEQLAKFAPDALRDRGWPRSAAAIANALRRLQPVLRVRGLLVDFARDTGHDRTRMIRILRSREDTVRAVRQGPAERKADDADDPDGVLAQFGLLD